MTIYNSIKSRLVNGKIKEFYQLEERYIVHIPTWLIRNFQERYTIKTIKKDTMPNDNNSETVIEKIALDSIIAQNFDYITRDEMEFQEIDSLTQWEIDNPEYKSF